MKHYQLLVALILSMPTLCIADTLSVEPGMWRMSMTMEMSMMPQPQVRNFEECITKDEMTPEDFSISEDDSGCAYGVPEIKDNTATWTISCPNGAGQMQGQWSITSMGDSIEGVGHFDMEMQGQAVDVNMHWQGNRVGECD
jgi:hypothetical protein